MTTTEAQRSPSDDLRAEELETARIALDSGTGVVVTGPPGSGRSTFVSTVVGRLDTTARERLWVGDDMLPFDDENAKRFGKAVTSGEIVPLVTSVSSRPFPEAIATLWQNGAVVRVELRPVAAKVLLNLAESFLHGGLDQAAVAAFVPPRGGSDLAALRLALLEAQHSGALRSQGDRWHLVSDPAPSAVLRRLLQSRSGSGECSAPTSTLLDLVALTPEISVSTLIEIAVRLHPEADAEAELERLEDLGVLEILAAASKPHVRFRDGLIELLLQQTIGALRRRRLIGATVVALDGVAPAELGPGELVAYARHGRALDLAIEQETLTRAATTSLRYPDALLSLRLAEAAVAQNGGFDAEMALAAAEAQLGESEKALARLRRLVAEADGDAQFGEALAALTHQVLVRASDPQVLESLERRADATSALPNLRLDALKGFMLFTLGDAIGAARLVEPALAQFSDEELGQAQLVMANAAFLTGRLGLASSSLDAAEAAMNRTGADTSTVHVLRANVNVFRGRISESLAVVEQFRNAAAAFGRPAAQAYCGWAVGMVLVFAGRAREAVAELQPAIELMERLGLTGAVGRTARSDLATALAMTGRPIDAAEVLAATSAPPPGIGVGKLLHAEGWIAAASGRRDEAASTFFRSADTYAAQGLDLASLNVLVDAARVGAASAALPRIDALADVVEGEHAALIVRFSRALARSEDTSAPATDAELLGDEFDAIGEAAALLEVNMIGAEAFAHAALLQAAAGSPRKAAASLRRRVDRTAACGLEHLPLAIDVEIDRLSDREAEIAELAASGLSNRAIAAQLVVSVRTVETHLQRVYKKLGVRARSELSTSWLRSRD